MDPRPLAGRKRGRQRRRGGGTSLCCVVVDRRAGRIHLRRELRQSARIAVRPRGGVSRRVGEMKRAIVIAALSACSSSSSFFDDPTQPLPAKLSDLGVAELPAYDVNWPLWSNGSTKQRS